MKKTLLIIAIVSTFAACSSKKNETDTAQQISADTAGLAEFQNWKVQKEQLQDIDINALPDVSQNNITPITQAPALIQPAQPRTRVIYRDRPARRAAPVRRSQPVETYEEPVVYGTPATKSREAVSRNGSGTSTTGEGTGTGVGDGTGTGNGPVASADPAPKKTGWSKAAKGTVIGAASGAVLGAVVTKGSAKGTIIGGVVGGLGGYVLGRSKDKKDGRYFASN
jgi:hypothetical protein